MSNRQYEKNRNSPIDALNSQQLVGKVMAYQGNDVEVKDESLNTRSGEWKIPHSNFRGSSGESSSMIVRLNVQTRIWSPKGRLSFGSTDVVRQDNDQFY